MRHALLHMFFPDQYERSISTRDKVAMVETYRHRVARPLPGDVDQALRLIREAIAPQYSTAGGDFDFYEPHVKQEWRPGAKPEDPQPPDVKEVSPEAKSEPPAGDGEVSGILQVLAYTRNVILYGPPGTGKTYLANQVAQALVRPQLQEAVPEAARLQRLAAEVPFYELLALAMYQVGPQHSLAVTELMQTPLVEARLQISPVAHPRESVWNNLQSHTAPDSTTVRVSRRVEPFLFDKHAESRWRLTAEGRAYVEKDLAEPLSTLRRDDTNLPSAAEYIVWTTFHQSYSYEDFVEGIRPQTDEAGEMTYPVVPGALREISHRASAQPDKKFVLVIDEINRGNIAKVFGELITLLEDDKRGRLAMRLPYSGQIFTVPPNLYVIGTMNTADRSIALLDVALRRRFAFVELTPQPDVLADAVVRTPETEVWLGALLSGLNDRIRGHLGRDYEIGHSYLLKISTASPEAQLPLLEFVWNNQIVPLLHEYFYSQPDKLREVLKSFVSEVDEDESGQPDGTTKLGIAFGDDLIVALRDLSSP
jgi:5-methylcytosine-specific restriction protein B